MLTFGAIFERGFDLIDISVNGTNSGNAHNEEIICVQHLIDVNGIFPFNIENIKLKNVNCLLFFYLPMKYKCRNLFIFQI